MFVELPFPDSQISGISCPHMRTRWGLPREPRILSISKRTDIPAFYLSWLLERLAVGWVDVPNPMLAGRLRSIVEQFASVSDLRQSGRIAHRRALDEALQKAPWGDAVHRDGQPLDRLVAQATTHVSLRQKDVRAVVWWSKNYAVYLRLAAEIDVYWKDVPQYFHFTINPRRPDLRWLEPDVPPLEESKRQLRELAMRAGPHRISWRYDPLVFWRERGQLHSSWDRDFFEEMCSFCAELGVQTCVTSIADHYKKFVRRMKRFQPHLELVDPDETEIRRVAEEMGEVAGRYGIKLQACTESSLAQLHQYGFSPASCIDAEALIGTNPRAASDRRFARRASCGCHAHVDIGDYEWQECGYGCIYCYANPNHRYYPVRGEGHRRDRVDNSALARPGAAEDTAERC